MLRPFVSRQTALQKREKACQMRLVQTLGIEALVPKACRTSSTNFQSSRQWQRRKHESVTTATAATTMPYSISDEFNLFPSFALCHTTASIWLRIKMLKIFYKLICLLCIDLIFFFFFVAISSVDVRVFYFEETKQTRKQTKIKNENDLTKSSTRWCSCSIS